VRSHLNYQYHTDWLKNRFLVWLHPAISCHPFAQFWQTCPL
jgi:hypothetical protein